MTPVETPLQFIRRASKALGRRVGNLPAIKGPVVGEFLAVTEGFTIMALSYGPHGPGVYVVVTTIEILVQGSGLDAVVRESPSSVWASYMARARAERAAEKRARADYQDAYRNALEAARAAVCAMAPGARLALAKGEDCPPEGWLFTPGPRGGFLTRGGSTISVSVAGALKGARPSPDPALLAQAPSAVPDPHLSEVARAMGIPYERALELYRAGDKDVVAARGAAKVRNFGIIYRGTP
jgi:hypothetical protein